MLVGAIAGMASGWLDAVLMWACDLFLSLPQLPLLLLIIYLFRNMLSRMFGTEGGVFILIVVRDRRAALDAGGTGWCGRSPSRSGRRNSSRAARALGASKMRLVVAPHPAQRAGPGDRRRHH